VSGRPAEGVGAWAWWCVPTVVGRCGVSGSWGRNSMAGLLALLEPARCPQLTS
jgi:hypothetical protein